MYKLTIIFRVDSFEFSFNSWIYGKKKKVFDWWRINWLPRFASSFWPILTSYHICTINIRQLRCSLYRCDKKSKLLCPYLLTEEHQGLFLYFLTFLFRGGTLSMISQSAVPFLTHPPHRGRWPRRFSVLRVCGGVEFVGIRDLELGQSLTIFPLNFCRRLLLIAGVSFVEFSVLLHFPLIHFLLLFVAISPMSVFLTINYRQLKNILNI